MNKEIRLRRNKLLEESMELRTLLKDPCIKNNYELYQLQKQKWKKYEFFNNYIKEKERKRI